MQSQNLFTTATPVAKAQFEAPKKSFEQISTEIANAAERRQFFKTIAITVMIFTGISAIAIGYIITNRFSNVNAQTPTKLIVKDDVPAPQNDTNQIVITRRPTRTPTQEQQIQSTTQSQTILPPTQSFFATPYLFQTPFPTPIGLVFPTLTPLPGITSVATSATPSPTVTQTPTQTLTPTVTLTPQATPTGALSSSLDYSSNSGAIVFDTTPIGSAQIEEFTIRNVGQPQVGITDIVFATSGSRNPFSIVNDTNVCLTNSQLPYYLNQNNSKCIRVKFTPTSTSQNSNTLVIYWNNSYKLIYLSGTVPTVTLTPTPTSTPTPTP